MNLTKRSADRLIFAAISVIAPAFSGGCGDDQQGIAKRNDPQTIEKATNDAAPPTAAPALKQQSQDPAAQKTVKEAAGDKVVKNAVSPPQKPGSQSVASTIEEAVAKITKVGGKVFFDETKANKPAIRVRFQNRNVSDAVIANLKYFPEITQLEIIYPSNITDAALENIAPLTNLRSVDLEGTRITDAGLAHIKGLKDIERLRLINTRITGAGVAHLKDSTKLSQLLISFTDVDDGGLKSLEGLSALQLLELDDSKVTQAGVDRIKQALPKCKVLWNPNGASPGRAAAPEKSDRNPKVALSANGSTTRDWPSWRGPNRDARSPEVGLLNELPTEGPPLRWTAAGIGTGYSTIAIAYERIFATGRVGGAKAGTYLFCLDAAGKKQWERLIVDDKFPPFSMPTSDGDLVYALAHEGELICVRSSNGEEVWRKNLVKDFSGEYMARGAGGGYSESVLIDGDRLICTPGAKDAAMAALNKKTGATIWKAAYPSDVGPQGQDAAGMSSAVVSNACGIRQYVQMSGRGLISVAAETGKTLWTYNGIADTFANISTPIVTGDYVFASTSQGSDRTAGTALLKLVSNNDNIKPEVVYRLDYRTAANHHGGMVLVGDYIYMGHGHNRGFPLCLEMKTGKVAWRPGRGPGNGSAAVLYADGHIYFRYEDGTVALVEANPAAYVLKGQFKTPPDTDTEWAHPVISNGGLYLRGQNRLLCYDIKRKQTGALVTDETTAQAASPLKPDQEQSPKAVDPPIPTVEDAIAKLIDIQAKITFDQDNPKKPVTYIRIENRRLDDSNMVYLRPFSAIKNLEIVDSNNVTGKGLQQIAELVTLEWLSLDGIRVGDAGMQHLKGLTNLKYLNLTCTDLTDAGLVNLVGMKGLRHLLLSFNDVSDAGIEHLARLKSLKLLELDDTKVSETGVNKLKQALPGCRFFSSESSRGSQAAAKRHKDREADSDSDSPQSTLPVGADWPQWRGPNRDGLSNDTGLLREWPPEGPPLSWEASDIGWGYSSPSIQNGKVFTAGCFTRGMSLTALDASNGKKIWQVVAADDKQSRVMSTPTVDGEFLYVLAWEGELVCARTSDGSTVWHRNLAKEFGGVYMAQGMGGAFSESVLIDGDNLICTPGAKDSTIVCLNKKTGETLWKATFPPDVGQQGVDAAGFSSPIISTACGVRQYVQLCGRGLISVAADNGRTLWAYNGIANIHANISTPVASGDYVFASTVHAADKNAGTVLLKIVPDKGGVKADVAYRLTYRTAVNHHGGMVLIGDYIYMGHGYNRGFPLCLEMQTGKIMWRPGRGPGTGSASVIYADGRLYFRYEDGVVALVEATPHEYVLKGSFKLPLDKDKDWSHPVISHGRLYLQGQHRLLCYNVAR